jgi:hypothetical protein
MKFNNIFNKLTDELDGKKLELQKIIEDMDIENDFESRPDTNIDTNVDDIIDDNESLRKILVGLYGNYRRNFGPNMKIHKQSIERVIEDLNIPMNDEIMKTAIDLFENKSINDLNDIIDSIGGLTDEEQEEADYYRGKLEIYYIASEGNRWEKTLSNEDISEALHRAKIPEGSEIAERLFAEFEGKRYIDLDDFGMHRGIGSPSNARRKAREESERPWNHTEWGDRPSGWNKRTGRYIPGDDDYRRERHMRKTGWR